MRTRDEPGLPLSVLAGQHRCAGVRFDCRACKTHRDVAFADVAADLERRGLGGWDTPIRHVARHARKPCRCGALDWTSGPWWT